MTNNAFYQFISGGVMTGSVIAAAFFFRFRIKTGERLFSVFGWAFLILALERVLLLLYQARQAEKHPLIYLVRFVAFAVILFGILSKNKRVQPRKRFEND